MTVECRLKSAHVTDGSIPVTKPHIDIHSFSVLQLKDGELFRGWLDVDCGAGAPAALPVGAARGQRPGPTLCIVAGVHGNEYEGMEAIRRLWAVIDPSEMHGSLVTVLAANPFAYAARSRATPKEIDGKNLARVFPGSPTGTPTERLAASLLDLVERNMSADDLFVDLHSGTGEVAFATMAGFRDIQGAARERSEEAARHMGLPLLWAIPDSQGPFNAETTRRGIPTIGTETTGRAGCRPDDVALYEQGLWNLLRFMEITRHGPMPMRDERPALPTIDVYSPAAGFVHHPGGLGQSATSGQVIGTIIDPFGDVITEVRSPVSGEIWAAIASPVVEAGDLLFMIADGDRASRMTRSMSESNQ